MPWGVAAAVGAAAVGSAVSGAMAPSPNDQASAADPFRDQRWQYQQQLSDLMKNPSSITNDPGYQFGLQTGVNQVQGSAAAKGMLNSGNTLAGIDQFSQQYAGQYLNNQELLLAQLAGANIGSPGTAGQIMSNTANQASAAGNSIGNAVGTAIQGYGSSGSYQGGNPFATDTSGYGAGSNTYGFTTGANDPSYGVSGGMFGG
jgi:hypothetical protein